MLCLIIFLPNLPAQTAPRGMVVLDEIAVLGLDAHQRQILLDLMPVRAGEPIDQEDLAEINRRLETAGVPHDHLRIGLLPMEQAADAAILPAKLIFDFRPPFALSDLRVFTLLPVEPDEIAEALTMKAGDVYDRDAITSQSLQLEARARALGYHNVEIIPFEDQHTSQSVRLTYFVQDHRPPKLDGFSLRKAGFLQSFMFHAGVKNIPEKPFSEDADVTAQTVLELRELARRFFSDQGWLDADVAIEEIRVKADDEDLRQAHLYYRVNRGERYRIGDVAVAGHDHIPEEAFDDVIEHYKGRKFLLKDYRELGEEIERISQAHGFMAPTVKMNYGVRPGRPSVAVAADIDEGTTSTLNDIRIIHRPYPEQRSPLTRLTGSLRKKLNPRVSREVIERQIFVQPGDPLNRAVIDASETNLHSMRIFDEIKLSTEPTSDPLKSDLIVDLQDKLTAALSFTAGWSDQAGPFGSVEYVENNMFGLGDQLALSARFSKLTNRGHITYTDRNWKLGDRLLGHERAPSLAYSLFYTDGFYNEYVEEHRGGTMTLGCRRPESPLWHDNWQLRLENIHFDPDRDEDDYEEKFHDYLAATLGYFVSHDTRRFADWSREGHNFLMGMEVGAADGFLARFTTAYDIYLPITKRLGWVTKTQLGLIPTDAEDIGLADRFQGGGTHDLRGFDVRGIGPVDSKVDDLRIGGATKLFVQNELRLMVRDNIMAVTFLDLGTLSAGPLNFSDWRASAGAGVRMKLPEFNNEVFLYFSEAIMAEDTDAQTSIHMGVQFAF